MDLDVRVAQTTLENVLRDAILFALGARLPPVASIAVLRSRATRGSGGISSQRNDDEIVQVVTSSVVTSAYRWFAESIAVDNGTTVIQPTDVTGSQPGRWLAWTTPVRLQQTVGGPSAYLHELQPGDYCPVRRVIVLDKDLDEAAVDELLEGQVPAVVISAADDVPEDATMNVGALWETEFHFNISVITQSLRDRRQAAQGSDIAGDADALGANSIDGLIQALLAGTNLYPMCNGIRAIRCGRGFNAVSGLGQRRVVRERYYTIQATVTNPAAPNDAGPTTEVDVNADLVDPNLTPPPPSTDAYLISGIGVPATGTAFTVAVASGQAVIAGLAVSYAGESHDFDPESDTYRDLNPVGTMTFISVTADGEVPPVTSGALRIGVSRSNGSGVIDDRIVALTKVAYGPTYQIPLS